MPAQLPCHRGPNVRPPSWALGQPLPLLLPLHTFSPRVSHTWWQADLAREPHTGHLTLLLPRPCSGDSTVCLVGGHRKINETVCAACFANCEVLGKPGALETIRT